MTITQQQTALAAAPAEAAASDREPMRELTLAELESVAGGAPHGNWQSAVGVSSLAGVPAPAPHGQW